MGRLPEGRGRAAALIAASVIVIGAASLAYLHPTLTTRTSGPSAVSIKPSLVTSNLITYDFVSPLLGWAVETQAGQFRVYRTTDGAKHWQKQLDLGSSFAGFFPISVQFLDHDHGFVGVGDPFEQLNRTSDGGTTWDSLPLPTGSASIDGLAFSSSSYGWLLVGGQARTLYATSDAGSTWRRLPDPPADAYNLGFRNSAEVWLGSAGLQVPHVYRSTDAGQSWQRHDLPPPPGRSWMGGPYFPASVNLLPGGGVVASMPPLSQPETTSNLSFTSFDQGTTWRYTPPPPGVFAFQDALHWWAMKGTSLFKSSDAGQAWTLVTNALPDWQYIPHVIDAKHAWALIFVVGGYGLALTNDGGIHWIRGAVPQA